MPTDPVLRELTARQLDAWLPGALQRSRRATLAVAGAPSDAETPEAAVRAVGAAGAGLRGRRLTVLVLADGTEELPARLGAAEAELPTEVAVHLVPGDHTRLPVALKAAGAAGAPLLTVVDWGKEGPLLNAYGREGSPSCTPAGAGGPPVEGAEGTGLSRAVLAAAASGRPAELLVVADTPVRAALTERFPLVAEVEWVPADGAPPRLVAFATGSDRGLDAFKAGLWEVAGQLGGRLRDPADPTAVPLAATTDPDPAPLGRELLAELARSGPRTVTELRRHTLTATGYRSADAVRAVTGLLDAGAARRDPEHGRLGGDVVIHAGASPSAWSGS
ncbi:hypothetical protein AWW66_20910 [Micromonospora rosaria]|uniref:Uncharacterized protein n=1 Tax=Micromonospora rosaria TaxID=47874 RepID=A0A136PNX2_9ACTN|nr:hypothetical protein [Micromonospora rosaria]KXK60054.1 hypothetical protein AWW66_20910 [Micromonospora rosaria]